MVVTNSKSTKAGKRRYLSCDTKSMIKSKIQIPLRIETVLTTMTLRTNDHLECHTSF